MVKGTRASGTFPTSREASQFKARRTAEILAQDPEKPVSTKTLADALDDYALKVSPTKRGSRWELIRLAAYKKQGLPLTKPLGEVSTVDLVRWRDDRLALNARGSVLRDITLLGNVFEVARREWQWIDSNPMRDVKKPQNPDHRERVISFREIRVMLRALRYKKPVRSVGCAVAHAFLLGLSTGMRAGEICALKWSDVKEDHVVLHVSKTGKGRPVALSAVGTRIIERMRGWDEEMVFGITSQSLDRNFRKYRDKGGLTGFTFHDSRHTAATRVALLPGMTEMVLCKLFGWKGTKQALTYFNPSPKQMASML
jgi:integrase